MVSVHVNIEDKSGRVYCHRIPDLVQPNSAHYAKHCSKCQYFVDTVVGKGVSCAYDDESNGDTAFNDAVVAERYAKTQQVKMGLITQEEANATMIGYDDEQVEEISESELAEQVEDEKSDG